MSCKSFNVAFKLGCVFSFSALLWVAAAERPNIVIVMVDDMGFSDIGCYGGEIETPNLDALANQGVRFTQFYNTARCSPSRASLITGLYPHQAGMGYLDNLIKPHSQGTHGRLHERCVTIAEVLGSAGYHTSISGKWHLGLKSGCNPWERGFDRSTISAYGEVYFPKEAASKGASSVYLDGRELPKSSSEFAVGDWYSTFVLNDWALKFIDDAKNQGKPFFLYLAHGAPHFPLRAPQKEIDKYRGRFHEGWDVLRKRRYERQKKMGLVKESWPLIERPDDVRDWEGLSAEERARFDNIMAVYAAMIDCVDQSMGQLVAGLKERALYENTLILFLSDNGGNAEGGPDGITSGDPNAALGSPFSNVFLGMSWATLSNTPFRRYKHFTHEGGISTPLIAHWPAGIDKSRYGKLEHQPGHLVDLMATAVDLAQADYPQNFKGHKVLAMEGCSLVPAFAGQPLERVKPIFWEHEGNRAIRQGEWKLVMKLNETWELYNIEDDRTEQKNLAAMMPERTKAMAELWEAWAAKSFVDQWQDEERTPWGHVKHPEPEKVSPEIGGIPFVVTATVESERPQGVVMAQGGLKFGFSLFFKEGCPAFAYRNSGNLKVITANDSVKGRIELRVLVDDKKLILFVNGGEAAACDSGGLMKEQPALGLYIGLDGVHPVGEYEVPNKFKGRIIRHEVKALPQE
ncbi:MAG: arylsulfatase [Kiritimatiellae bacterium]|nr:arylsulfatase [Kiritimatiellia bacterium]